MIIDDVGIHHGDWPLISINADRDIKNSNWRAKMMRTVCARMFIRAWAVRLLVLGVRR